MKIIGFSGKIGVGKNYIGEKIFGKKLYDLGYTIHTISFADQLKYELGSKYKHGDLDIVKLDETYDGLFESLRLVMCNITQTLFASRSERA
ncbi:MAG: hypothetical protein Gaeavirus17_6 [Gaeavirus sp.]|uniref:Uncharacterized protein n=1 Tax=Gaeavirus sp. TaxID=2487767 RepID=A0A3G4ZZC8_9VIRU|nr:MAG: hypothetical protein Gaeavirus17_6 [Gaeavirus sp.]